MPLRFHLRNTLILQLGTVCACTGPGAPDVDASWLVTERDAAVLDAAPLDAATRDAELPVGLASNDAGDHDAASPLEQALLDHTLWRAYDAALDPLAEHQPAVIVCGVAGWYADKQAHLLDVETSTCNYALLEHPAQLAVSAGSELHLRLWYFDLIAPEPAEAHLAVLFGDDVVWETHVPIPSSADAIDVRFSTSRALALGEPIRWHLHNHGQNSWILASLALSRAP